jgi:aminoglycoside phosphotransferase
VTDLATYADVEANYRSLRPAEQERVVTWLKAASAELRFKITDLDSRMSDADYAEVVKAAVIAAVLRRLHWPPTESTPWNWFSTSEIDRLSLSAGTSSGLPVGSFPDPCAYPVF